MSLAQFRLSYEISPITFVGGIAGSPGAKLPIVSLLQSSNYATGVSGDGGDDDLDDYFAKFTVMPGGKLASNQFSTYPYINVATAANGIITQPLGITLKMICPATSANGYAQKTAIITALQSSIAQHTALSGTYQVATPAFLYDNLLLAELTDITPSDGAQPQSIWQWTFFQPLITSAQTAQAYSSLMNKLSNGTQVSGDPPSYSGVQTAEGQSQSGVTPSVIPAAQPLIGAGQEVT